MDPSLTSAADSSSRSTERGAALRPGEIHGLAGGFVTLDGEAYYRITAYDRMRPFLMSLASDTDLWMFVTSGGGLTAGRRDPDGALFPYETVDRLHDGHHHTGPITLLRVEDAEGGDGRTTLWKPFADETAADLGDSGITRNLYKNVVGNRLVFEETNHGLGLRFRYRWSGCDEFGLVRTATLENTGSRSRTLSLLDGLRNVLPHGAPLALYQHSSVLVDAYKRADCDPSTRLATFSLTSKITDRAEAAEELRATTVWSRGLRDFQVCLSLDAVAAFRRGDPLAPERALTGRRGNYLVHATLVLQPGEAATWHIVADVGRSHVEATAIRARLLAGEDLGARIEERLATATETLVRMVASADGLQRTGHPEADAHHFANVLFNSMRGGIFTANHDVPIADLIAFLRVRNRAVVGRFEARLRALPAALPAPALLAEAEGWNDPDILRLCHEYLPLYFGRRHGDPSRPWNRFSIQVENPDGSRALHYEGNWRDIFQNWEALAVSFPGFLPQMIAKFVNASTADGFNPYRVTRDGFDWEKPDPSTPWGHIGYWGDHQIVYLLGFLRALRRGSPGALEGMLTREIFAHAEVPYRLKPYERIAEDPRHTIEYDAVLAARIEERVAAEGTDGQLVHGRDGSIHYVNLLEKLFIPALSKVSNFVPGGGIWMNTQRPEWNDANNALAGHGLSMVTLFHLRHYLRFLEDLLAGRAGTSSAMSVEVATWLRRLQTVLTEQRPRLAGGPWTPRDRMFLLDALGTAFSDYRAGVYARGLGGEKEQVPAAELAAFCHVAIEHLDHTILGNRRDDGLFHSYNLLEIARDRGEASLHDLDEMLEGQVAALASDVVDAAGTVRLLTGLFESRLYHERSRSFLLYPDKELPAFLDRNRVPEVGALAVPLLRDLLDAGEPSILERDALGVCRFQADLRHAPDLAAALDRLALQARWTNAVARDRRAVLDLFESVFRHQAFTGRSGAMYAYEGLGSIYWHMVAKLLLAVQEIAVKAERDGQPAPIRSALVEAYFRIRAGLGYRKSVAEFGAFPTDPYSHTPAHAGAQQPGMTGQVKEMILARFGELGVEIQDGLVRFRPTLLERSKFLGESTEYRMHDFHGTARSITLPGGSLAFSFCQVPVVYALGEGEAWIRVTAGDGASRKHPGRDLDAETSRALFERRGAIARIDVGVPSSTLRGS